MKGGSTSILCRDSAKVRPRVAWFSLFPGVGREESKGAYASQLLLPLLGSRWELELFSPTGYGENFQGYEIQHYLTAFRRDRESPFDLFLYNLEDHPECGGIRIHAALKPGATWFHDFVFSNFGPEPILNSSWRATVEKFYYPEIPWPQVGVEFKQRGPYGFREAGTAFLALFSHPWWHTEYERLVETSLARRELAGRSDLPVSVYLPLPATVGELVGDARRLEQRGDKMVVGLVGSPGIESRAEMVLEVLAQFPGAHLLWLIAPPERPRAQELCERHPTVRVDLRVGRSPLLWEATVRECDLALHLHYSVFGAPSPYLQISAVAGVPCVVSNFESGRSVPPHLVYALDPGEREGLELLQLLRAIESGEIPRENRELAAAAREIFDPHVVAEELVQWMTHHTPYLKERMARWAALELAARQNILQRTSRNENLAALFKGAERGPGARLVQDLGWD